MTSSVAHPGPAPASRPAAIGSSHEDGRRRQGREPATPIPLTCARRCSAARGPAPRGRPARAVEPASSPRAFRDPREPRHRPAVAVLRPQRVPCGRPPAGPHSLHARPDRMDAALPQRAPRLRDRDRGCKAKRDPPRLRGPERGQRAPSAPPIRARPRRQGPRPRGDRDAVGWESRTPWPRCEDDRRHRREHRLPPREAEGGTSARAWRACPTRLRSPVGNWHP